MVSYLELRNKTTEIVMLTAGIDEAGRSPILGPIYYAGVSLDEKAIEELIELGLKDSKLCTMKQVLTLYERIVNIAESIIIIEVKPSTVDDWVEGRHKHDPKYSRGLNGLSAFIVAKLIDGLEADKYYVDSPDQNTNRFKDTILKYCSKNLERENLVAEPHADETCPVVSAASIIAYHKRKMWSRRFEEKYGLSPDVLWITPRLNLILYRISSNLIRKSWNSWKRHENMNSMCSNEF